jgi:hypothetical protein
MKIDSTASDISAHDIAAMLPTGKWLEGECISLQQTFATGDIFFFFFFGASRASFAFPARELLLQLLGSQTVPQTAHPIRRIFARDSENECTKMIQQRTHGIQETKGRSESTALSGHPFMRSCSARERVALRSQNVARGRSRTRKWLIPSASLALLAFFRDARDDELVGRRLRVVNFAGVYHSRDLAFDRPRARASRRVR